MAKISANGATKLAERRRTFTTTGHRTLTSVSVLTSDGRILSRLVHSDGTSDGYRVVARIRPDRVSLCDTETTLLDIFHAYCDRRNYEPRVGQRDLSGVDVYQSGSHLESSHTA